MRRIFYITAFILMLLFSSCSTGSAEIDLSKLGEELTASGAFNEIPELIDSSVGCTVYAIDEADCTESYFWFSSGATSEEIALIKAVDEDAASRISDAVNERIRFQIESFKDYVPEEVPKLEAATVYTDGLYIIYCCADDNEGAKSIIDE